MPHHHLCVFCGTKHQVMRRRCRGHDGDHDDGECKDCFRKMVELDETAALQEWVEAMRRAWGGTTGHWHRCEVCGAKGLFWTTEPRRYCGHDEDHDIGLCRECRLQVARLYDGTEQGKANLLAFFEAMQTKRSLELWRGKVQ
jgi:hypothetical protein